MEIYMEYFRRHFLGASEKHETVNSFAFFSPNIWKRPKYSMKMFCLSVSIPKRESIPAVKPVEYNGHFEIIDHKHCLIHKMPHLNMCVTHGALT